MVMTLEQKIKRLQNMRGNGIQIIDTPGGRIFNMLRQPGEGVPAVPGGGMFDVVTIGGYYGPPVGDHWRNVNDYYGEKNHILESKLTAAQVNAGAWAWGPEGADQVHFAIAAIIHNTRLLIPEHEVVGDWWNPKVPAHIIFARAWAENTTGDPITLTLTVGTIQP